MGYADAMALFKGSGKGVGPGVAPEDAQGGTLGALRTLGGSMKSAGAGFMQMSPKLAAMQNASDRASYGAYHDMMRTQHDQDASADLTNMVREVFASRPARDKYFKNSANPSMTTNPESI